MDRLRTKVAECQYREYDRLLTEQFISGLTYDGLIDKILKELQDIEDATDVMGIQRSIKGCKNQVFITERNLKALALLDKIHKSRTMLYSVCTTGRTDASIATQGTPKSALHKVRCVLGVGNKTILWKYAN